MPNFNWNRGERRVSLDAGWGGNPYPGYSVPVLRRQGMQTMLGGEDIEECMGV